MSLHHPVPPHAQGKRFFWICVCICIYIHTYIYMNIYIHVYMYIYMYVYGYIIYMYICIDKYNYTFIHTCILVSVRPCCDRATYSRNRRRIFLRDM